MATKTPAPPVSAPKRIPLALLARVEKVREKAEKAAGIPIEEGAALARVIEAGLHAEEKRLGLR